MEQFIRKLAKGNRKAQSKFYDQYSPLVMGTCIRYLHEKDLASDAFQDAFIKIFKNIHQLKDPASLPGWIKRITINVALDHLKAIKYQDLTATDDPEISDQHYVDLLDKFSTDAILDLISKLPDGYRIVFNMHIIDGYSHKEIAERLQIAESTSRSQLTHARQLLKEQLRKIGITRYEKVI